MVADACLAQELAGQAPSFEERIVSHYMCQSGAEVPARRMASDDEPFTKIGFQKGSV